MADPSSAALGDLITALTALDYSTVAIRQVLGTAGYHEALRGNPGAALRRVAVPPGDPTTDRAALLTLSFFLREPIGRLQLDALLGEELVERLVAAHILTPVENVPDATTAMGATGALSVQEPGALLRSTVDIRPVDHGRHAVPGLLIASDPDASLDIRVPGPNHVPGVGQAPLTLLNQVPADRVGRLLDLGTGSGVLALSLTAENVVATDVHRRALDFARASEHSIRHGCDHRPLVDWRDGSWFDPVAGEQFDRIVSNPPFVISDGEVGHIYRDSGLELDGASRLVVAGAAEHLAPGGTAHLLGAWATGFAESPASRVAGWLPSEGIRAWVIQRDEVDPETYVRTWLSDESIDLRTPAGRARTQRWLEVFAAHGVTRIGMGYFHLQRIDGPSEVTFEEIAMADLGYFGDEVCEWFLRADWLANQDSEGILDSHFAVRPTVVREAVEIIDASGAGFTGAVLRLSRTDGPRFSHEIDSPLSAILAGLNPHGLTLRDTAELYCAINDLDEYSFTRALVPLVVDLVRHGLLLPTELIDRSSDGPDAADPGQRQ